jgi:hypothetical protein
MKTFIWKTTRNRKGVCELSFLELCCLFHYQRFSPEPSFKDVVFEVPASDKKEWKVSGEFL